MLNEQEILELVATHGAAVNEGRPIKQLIADGELPRLKGSTVLEGKVSDSVFGEALKASSGRSIRLMFRNNRISTHDVNRGAIPSRTRSWPSTTTTCSDWSDRCWDLPSSRSMVCLLSQR